MVAAQLKKLKEEIVRLDKLRLVVHLEGRLRLIPHLEHLNLLYHLQVLVLHSVSHLHHILNRVRKLQGALG